jgi:Ras-related protein Rab-1A
MMEPINNEYDVLVKTVIIGEAGVGKTSFCTKLTSGEFSTIYTSTIGVDFFIKYSLINNKVFKLQLWDTAGQEKFNSISSLGKIKKWYNKINYYCNEDIKILGIGNKCDLPINADLLEIENFFNEKNIPFMNISVKNEKTFIEFENILHTIIYGIKPNYQDFEIIELEKNNKNKYNCC